MISKRTWGWLMAGAIFLCGGAAVAALADAPFVKLFEPSEIALWKNEGDGSEMVLKEFEGLATLEGSNAKQPWGGKSRAVTVDLDRYPVLQIRIAGATRNWYLILSGEQFPNGYVRLKESNETGLLRFNVPELCGVTGTQTFTVKLGLSQPKSNILGQEKVSFDQFVFISDGKAQPRAEAPKPEGVVLVLDPSGRGVGLWKESLDGGTSEVKFVLKDGGATVTGAMADRSWGASHRAVRVNLGETPILAVNVTACTKNWYLILRNPELPDGYISLMDSDKPGRYTFNVPEKTGLSGVKDFDLQVGVGNPKAQTNMGETVSFNEVTFTKP